MRVVTAPSLLALGGRDTFIETSWRNPQSLEEPEPSLKYKYRRDSFTNIQIPSLYTTLEDLALEALWPFLMALCAGAQRPSGIFTACACPNV